MEKKFNYQIKDLEILISRKFEAELAAVWDAFTDCHILDQWWAPKPWICHTKSQEFKVSGRWLYAMKGPNDEIHWSFFDYESIEPKNYFSGKDGFCDENGQLLPGQQSSEWKISFKSLHGICTMTSHCIYPNEKTKNMMVEMGFLEGFEIGLNQLENLLKTSAS